jgi:hypothetical protein
VPSYGRITTPNAEYGRRAHKRSLGIDIEGPFFRVDLDKTMAENAGAFVAELAKVGEREAKRRVAGAPRRTAGPSYSGRFIVGRTQALNGKRWAMTAVISAYGGINDAGLSKPEAIRVQASLAGRHNPIAKWNGAFYNIGTTPGHEGTSKVFARTAASLRRLVKKLDITKGLGG